MFITLASLPWFDVLYRLMKLPNLSVWNISYTSNLQSKTKIQNITGMDIYKECVPHLKNC